MLGLIASNLVLAGTLAPVAEPISLYREFTRGENLDYQLRSRIVYETTLIGQPFALPETMRLDYDFSLRVTDIKTDGFAVAEYRRPTMTITHGQTADSPPKIEKEDINLRLKLDISPVNAVTGVQELQYANPLLRFMSPAPSSSGQDSIIPPFVLQYLFQMHQMALFIGSLESSMDLSPKLPFVDVAPGDTWQQTVSFQPQMKEGQESYFVQRLDYNYVYDGLVDHEGRQVHKITATLNLDTDVARYIMDLADLNEQQLGIKSAPLKLDATIEFLLDRQTKHTLSAHGRSKGFFAFILTDLPNEPIIEQSVSGDTRMTLANRRVG